MSVEENKPAAEFAKLLGELDTMAKAMPDPEAEPDGDKKIAAADGADGTEGADAEGKDKKDADGKPMTKSLQVTLADGTVVDAEDGTELVKSLIERIDASDVRATETESVMAKALGVAVDLIKSQGEQLKATKTLVKSLEAKVGELSNEGRGRKTTVSVHEKPSNTMAKSQSEGIDSGEFMAKAMTAMAAGKISGLDIATAEASINRGNAIPEHIVARVMSS